MPDEYSILAAKEQNYLNFYDIEINIREKLNYPPFCDIIIAVLSGNDENMVEVDSKLFYDIFSKKFKTFLPMPAPISRINGNYRWRVIIKEIVDDKKRDEIKECLNEFYNEHNSKVKLSFDINPNNMS